MATLKLTIGRVLDRLDPPASITVRAEQARLLLFAQGATDRAKGVARTSDGWRQAGEQRIWQEGWDATDRALTAATRETRDNGPQSS